MFVYSIMKKAVPLFLLCIFLFNTVGYYIAFKAVQYEVKNEIRSEIKSGIKTDELIVLTIKKNDLSSIQWEESGTEMRYKGGMYDIVKSTQTPEAIIFNCINDAKEESLFTNLDDHINVHVATNKPLKNAKKLIDTVVKLYFTYSQEVNLNVVETQHKFLSENLIFTSSVIEKNVPPPQFL